MSIASLAKAEKLSKGRKAEVEEVCKSYSSFQKRKDELTAGEIAHGLQAEAANGARNDLMAFMHGRLNSVRKAEEMDELGISSPTRAKADAKPAKKAKGKKKK